MRWVVFTVVILLVGSTALARELPDKDQLRQIFLATQPGPNEECRTATVPTYNVNGFFLDTSVETCGPYIRDVTVGRNAMPTGYQLFLVGGQYSTPTAYAFVRAKPQKAYLVPEYELVKREYLGIRGEANERWSNAVTLLPFVPMATFAWEDNGHTIYLLGDLQFPNGKAAAAPLDENSIILTLDGFVFTRPEGLFFYLRYRSSQSHMEVTYYQRGESPLQIRRAFVPTTFLPDADEAYVAQWNAMTQASDFGKHDAIGHYITLAAAAFAIYELGSLLSAIDAASLHGTPYPPNYDGPGLSREPDDREGPSALDPE